MSYLPAKRQRSNTSRESSNAIPQTSAPALRQLPNHLSANLALYPTGAPSAGYSNSPYAATQSTAAPAGHHPILAFASYSANPVTTHHGAYGSGGYQNNASTTGYGAAPYSPQHQPNPYANQYTHPQASPQLSPHTGQYALPGLSGVQNAGFTHNPQSGPRMTYSPVPTVSKEYQTATSYSQQPPQRSNPAISTMQQSQAQHGGLSSYGDSYSSHTPTHSGQYQTASPSYQDTSMTPHYSPAPMPTPQSHDVSRNMSEDLTENDDEDAQGEPADDSAEIYTNPDPARPPISSIPTPSTESRPGEISCACKKGRGKKKACISCGCSKYGLSCNSACSCGSACGNPFADLSAYFGPSGTFPKPCGANPCFATWLRNQPNVEELDRDLIVDMLLSDDKSWEETCKYTEGFRQWEEQWKRTQASKSKKSKEERDRLEFELLRAALGNSKPEDFHGFRYSFCQMQWVSAELWDHCSECRMCRSSAEWHCHKHDRCTENRTCPSCVSTTLPYHHQQTQQQQQQQQQHAQQQQQPQQQQQAMYSE
ncbi:hypothetical protein GGR50DRAFT_636347 [Xylaria sp. CBS 124048]|nr:hypothetical protein GGR50DRAFT_636347 [Xylaria sp. CBS 124048]